MLYEVITFTMSRKIIMPGVHGSPVEIKLPRLVEGQLIYAATDAWVAIELYKKLTSHFPQCEVETLTTR